MNNNEQNLQEENQHLKELLTIFYTRFSRFYNNLEGGDYSTEDYMSFEPIYREYYEDMDIFMHSKEHDEIFDIVRDYREDI